MSILCHINMFLVNAVKSRGEREREWGAKKWRKKKTKGHHQVGSHYLPLLLLHNNHHHLNLHLLLVSLSLPMFSVTLSQFFASIYIYNLYTIQVFCVCVCVSLLISSFMSFFSFWRLPTWWFTLTLLCQLPFLIANLKQSTGSSQRLRWVNWYLVTKKKKVVFSVRDSRFCGVWERWLVDSLITIFWRDWFPHSNPRHIAWAERTLKL